MQGVILVGYRGSGKTTVGAELARRTGMPLLDCDRLIEERAGRVPAELFATVGEAGFRDLESAVLQAVLSGPAAVIVATGGGIVERAVNRSALSADPRRVIYLQAPPEVLAARLSADPGGRPSLTGAAVAEEVAEVLARREPWYRAVADRVITVDRPLAAVVDAIEAVVENDG